MNWLTFIPKLLGKIFQVKISFIGFNGNAQVVMGNANATHKLFEFSVALITLGLRLAIRI
jgi:hypothetical protein